MRASDGQASVELVGTAWALLLSALVGFQLLAAGYGWAMAGHAAEAAALAVVNGRDPAPAARRALPGWPGSAIELQREGGRVAVTLFPPSPLPPLRRRLATTAEAEVREPAPDESESKSPLQKHRQRLTRLRIFACPRPRSATYHPGMRPPCVLGRLDSRRLSHHRHFVRGS